MSGPSWYESFSLAATPEHGGLLMPQLGFGSVFVVFGPGLSLGCYSWRRGWTGTFESKL